LKIKELAHIFVLPFFFLSIDYVLILSEKWVGLHFGRFFPKLIWSPCSASMLTADTAKKDQLGDRKKSFGEKFRRSKLRRYWGKILTKQASPVLYEKLRQSKLRRLKIFKLLCISNFGTSFFLQQFLLL
jgi:hypothetical protein